MILTPVDWAVIAAYFVLSIAIALAYSRRAAGSTRASREPTALL